jgi:hypothetical protein
MLKRFVCWILATSPIFILRAQSNFNAEGGGTTGRIVVFDNNGKTFSDPPSDIAGSPFLLQEWQLGSITLQSNKRYDSIRVRLNLQTQQVHFLNQNNVEMVLPKSFVTELVLRDSAAEGGPLTYTFQSGFPAIDNQSKDNFYRVLISGRLALLESIRKLIFKEKNQATEEESKEFRDYTEYYLYSDGILKRLKKDKDFILSLMADKKDQVQAYAQSKKLNFRSIDNIGQIVAYYDALP